MTETGLPAAQAWVPTITTLDSYGPYQRPAPLPRHWKQITAEWLTSVLTNKYPGVVVETLEMVELKNTHTSKLRMLASYNEVGRAAGLPPHICLKANFTGKDSPVDICKVEAQFYHDLAEGTEIPVPISYYSDWDQDGSGQGLVVLEDLIELGGEFGNTFQRIGVDAVSRAMEDLAILHGRFWGSPKLDTADWLPVSMKTPGDSDQPRILWWLFEENLARDVYIERLPEWMVADRQRFLRVYDLLSVYAQAQTGPYTIVHGDSYLGNTYLKPDGHRIWLDWQMVRKGHAWRDVSYFMVGALSVEERRTTERDLLAHYRDRLLATGAQDVPDVDTIFEHYRRWAMYGLMSWMGTKDHWGQDNHEAIHRFSVATTDLDTVTLLESQV
ncbi:MAG: hypothetical protein JWM76_306 [Pseudonocardiales bacterium]|nr:hypothetical protein [Pseudonocardiales bacterium]